MNEKYNTFSNRFWAGFIDGLVLMPIDFLDSYFLNSEKSLLIVIPWFIFSYSAFFIYSVCFHWKTGQTIGKRVMNVKVIDISEKKRLTFRQSFLRDSFYIISQITIIIIIVINFINQGFYYDEGFESYGIYLVYLSLIWFVIEIITMLTNNKRRALHDIIANSVVIKMNTNQSNK